MYLRSDCDFIQIFSRKEERMLVVFRTQSAGKVGVYFVGKENEAG